MNFFWEILLFSYVDAAVLITRTRCAERRILIKPLTKKSIFLVFSEVLKQYGSRMTEYERQEIEKYPEIWYLGLDACKINAKPGTPLNCGYDDDNGSYNKVSFSI